MTVSFGLDRVLQAGEQPINLVAACKLQRHWARQDTADVIAEIVSAERLWKEQ